MLRAVGFTDTDFDKPIVAVANGYSTITPCNLNLDTLAREAIESLRTAGTMPQVFGTITVSDGISMGTEGMKYSLVSREVIADSIETVCQAQSVDGLIAIGGCDKNMPGAMIAIARLNIPQFSFMAVRSKPDIIEIAISPSSAPLKPSVSFCARRIDEAELSEIERRACPGAGSCGGMFHGKYDVVRRSKPSG
jgi:dihydroxy-acid dehydratase